MCERLGPLLLLVSGCGVPIDIGPQSRDQTTLEELGRAVALVGQKAESEDAAITSASVTAKCGTGSDTNTSYRCSSGRLLDIKLIGAFPQVVTTGGPVDLPEAGRLTDFTVGAVLLIADAASGRACLIGVQTGKVTREPAATVLSLDRTK